MKVFIENLAKQVNGEPEEQLPPNTTIRFEGAGYKMSVHIDNDGSLHIYKRSDLSDYINIRPIVANTIKIS